MLLPYWHWHVYWKLFSHKFLLISNLMHFFTYLFINFISLYVSNIKCSSSGDRIVLIHHLVWLVFVSDCLVCRSYRHTKQSLTQANHTRWCINTIRSPDDEHLMRETCREMKQINKYMKKCIRLVIDKSFSFTSFVIFKTITHNVTPVCCRMLYGSCGGCTDGACRSQNTCMSTNAVRSVH
jgi:hypothetical protein